MMQDKILITDLDGTLVKNSIQVSEEDKQAIQTLEKEMSIGIATGRSLKEISYIEEQTGVKAVVRIGFNGAVVEVDGDIIFSEAIEPDVLNKVLHFIKDHHIIFDALDGEERIGTYQAEDASKLWNMNLIEPDNLFEYLQNKTIYKINVRPELGTSDKLLEQLKVSFPELAICKSGETRIEITPPGITKGQAIQLLKKRYEGLIYSAGDSENDISMFNVSDKSFCLSDASDSVKSHGDTVIDAFHEIVSCLNIGG